MSRVLLSIGAIQVLIMAVALMRSKLLSVLLGPAAFGIISTIDQTVLTLVSLGALSLPFTALKFMARSHSEGPEAFQRTSASFVRGLTALGVATVALVLALLVWRPDLFGDELAAYRGAVMIAILGVPAAMLTVLLVNTLAAAQRASASAALSLAIATVLMAAAVIGELAGGIIGLYVGTVLTGIVATGAGLLYLRRTLGVRVAGAGAGLLRALRTSPEIVSYSGLLYLAMGAYSLTMLATRYVVLGELGEIPAGLLQALLSLALTVGAVMTAMSNLVFTPLVNRRMPVAEKVAAADDFARKMVLLLLVAALPMVLFPRLVITTLFSSEFAPAAGMLFLFILWQCAYQIVNVCLQLLIGLDDVLYFCLVTCASYACAALLLPVLVPRLGLAGVPVALTAGMIVSGIAAAMRLRVRFSAGVSGAVLLRAALCLGGVALGGVVFPDVSTELTVTGALARVAYALTVWAMLWTTLSRTERELAMVSLARLGGRPRVRPGLS